MDANESDGTTRGKIQSRHLERLAYVYIRQSSLQQLNNNQESTRLQYNLVDRAREFGWSDERIAVIDEDLGKSGQSADNRAGFQKLLAELTLDHVGIILVVEMSRLARSCKDWYHLLELCGIFGALLADGDGIYDPTCYNDRLLLGLRGTMSEAELHVIRGRLWSGKLNKASRAELLWSPPAGYVRTPAGEVILDPDEQACAAVRLVFEKFRELGACHQLLDYMVKHQIKLGFRLARGERKGEIEWRPPNYSTLGQMLHNPFYAGAYAFGRRRNDARRRVPGKPYSGSRQMPMREWRVLIKDVFPAYITWEQYERNEKRLAANATKYGARGPAREGRALLGGVLICKRCDARMKVEYSKGGFFQYQCTLEYQKHAGPLCQNFSGRSIDALVEREILRAIEPASIELSLAAIGAMAAERDNLNTNWRQRLERAQYAVSRAERQYHAVEPENRLVARSLERAWEKALQEEKALQDDYDRFRAETPTELTVDEIRKIEGLARDLPTIWHAETTSPRDRKEIVRHLIEAVDVDTQGNSDRADVEIHWQGGQISRHRIRHQIRAYARMHDFEKIKTLIVEMRTAGHTSKEIAERLNREGLRPPKHERFNHNNVVEFAQNNDLPRIHDQSVRLRPLLKADEWPLSVLARELDVPYQTLYLWHKKGWLKECWTHERQGRWIILADARERKRLRDLYREHPQNRWRLHHEDKTLTKGR
jgi:DNA invertase Pin-like site-specific DNA recombinase